MHRSIKTIIAAAGATIIAVACCNATGANDINAPQQGVVTFAFEGSPQDTLRVLVNSSAAIAQAVNYIANRQGAKFPIGPIFRGAGVDARYPFHYDPDSVQLAEIATEVCDGRPMRTVAELNAFFQGATGDANATRAIWCPWGAYPIKVDGQS